MTGDEGKPVLALANHFNRGFTVVLRTLFSLMADFDAFMAAIFGFQTFLTAGGLALPFMAHLIANMATVQRTLAGFATADFGLEAIHVVDESFAATARLRHLMSTRRTLVNVAGNRTFMATWSFSSTVLLAFRDFGPTRQRTF